MIKLFLLHAPKKSRTRQSESGNVIFYILIAIALIAALSYAVSSSSRSGGDSALSEERARILATEILEYSNAIATATSLLKLRGCSDLEISFENQTLTGYANSNSPNNNICDIFHINGGGITYQKPNSAASNSQNWGFTGSRDIVGVGTTSPDLFLILHDVNREVCMKLNDMLNVPRTSGNAPADNGGDMTAFTGSYASGDALGDEDANLERQPKACYHDGDDDVYRFYYTLIAR